MKKILLMVLAGLVCGGMLTGCQQKTETTPPSTPPAMPSTNAPATTNAAGQ